VALGWSETHYQTIEGLRVHLSRLRVLSAAVIPLLLLTACGSQTTAKAVPSALDTITVGGTAKAPTLTFKTKPISVKDSITKVVTAGTGATVNKTQLVTFNYATFNGEDGKEVASSFAKSEPAQVELSDPTLIPGLRDGIVGQKLGARLLVAVPPPPSTADPSAPTYTVIFLIDLVAAGTPPAKTSAPPVKSGPPPLKTATGVAVPPKAGLPTVTVDGTKAAQITIPKTPAPTTLIVQPLIKGAGPVVKSGQSITVHYTGVLWKDGSKFDASGDRGKPATFPIGVGGVIPGWDKGLVGQTVGSRILLVLPPDDGYGAGGSPPKIGPNEPLVFVVDILGAN